LESIQAGCFSGCDALHVVDLAATLLKTLGEMAFLGCGATRVLVPASLREIESWAFGDTSLTVLDLGACEGIRVGTGQVPSLVELSLPRKGFAAAAKAFLRGSRIEIIRADVDESEVNELFRQVSGWGIDKLRVISPRLGEYEGQRTRESVAVELTNPLAVTEEASVDRTERRAIPVEWSPFLRALDLSGLAVPRLPSGRAGQASPPT
jgi:hypothetical protein